MKTGIGYDQQILNSHASILETCCRQIRSVTWKLGQDRPEARFEY